MDDREQRIRERAYQIWEEEGRPHGREREHWERAEREVDARDQGGQPRSERPGPDENVGSVGIASGLQTGGTKPRGGPAAGAGSLEGGPTGSPKDRSRT